jgi:hypothetical protein
MAKSKRRKTSKQTIARRTIKPNLSPKISSAIETELIIAGRLLKILGIYAAIMFFVIPLVYSFVDLEVLLRTPMFYVCMGLLVVLAGVQGLIVRHDRKRISAPRPSQADLAKYRRNGRWLFSLTFLMDMVLFLPFLYTKGYLHKLYEWLPGKQIFGEKLSFGLAFVVASIISGILGNAAYDILRFILKKLASSDK